DGSSADDGTQGGSSSGADTDSSDGSDSTDDTPSATTDDGNIDNVAVTHFDELFTEFAILNRDGRTRRRPCATRAPRRGSCRRRGTPARMNRSAQEIFLPYFHSTGHTAGLVQQDVVRP